MTTVPQAPPMNRHELLAHLMGWGLTEAEGIDLFAWLNGIAPDRPVSIMDFSYGDIAHTCNRLESLKPAETVEAWRAARMEEARPKTRAQVTEEGRQWLRYFTLVNPATGLPHRLASRVGGAA